jgi:flagellar protein FlaG
MNTMNISIRTTSPPVQTHEQKSVQKPAPESDTTKSTAAPAAAPSNEEVEVALQEIRQVVDSLGHNNLSFKRDESINRSIITVTDSETEEIIREIPSEEMVEIARQIRGKLTLTQTSVLFDSNA